jgi:hypothetical protein
MFKTILDTTDTTGLSVKEAIICICVALVLGLVISMIYIISDRKRRFSTNFAITLVILPAIVAIVIMLVGSNVARAFSMAGAFALVRFRSVPGDSKDIASVFFSMAVGLATGLGYISFAVVFTVFIGLAYMVLMLTGYGVLKTTQKVLRITIPENLNFKGVFDDVFEEYTKDAALDKVKTTNLGSMYELTYVVILKADVDEKKFIDDLRCRNGNLNIILCNAETKELL